MQRIYYSKMSPQTLSLAGSKQKNQLSQCSQVVRPKHLCIVYLQIRSSCHVKAITSRHVSHVKAVKISGLCQPNIGRHRIGSCIHDTVRLLSHKQSLISDHRDCRPTQTRVAKSLIKLDHLSAALNRKMLDPIQMNAATISEIYELGQGQSINIVRPVPA